MPRIDGAAVPKVIDFGVAKAVGRKLTEKTVYTQFSQLVGTPLYMSPEQAEFGVVDTGALDGAVRLWKTETGAPYGQPLQHEHAVCAVAFSPDGKLLASIA